MEKHFARAPRLIYPADMRVLVVEDEKKTASFVRKALQAEGFAADVCHRGDDALNAASATPFDVIVLDIMLPGRDGLSVLRQLRERRNATPILLLSARGEVNERVAGLNAGADDYLPKPFKVEELYAALNARLRKVQTVREGAERKLSTLRTQISFLLPHEMRTPLNGIISNAELLTTSAGTLGTAVIAEMGQEILQSGQRLERLIENFLFHARLELVATDPESVIALRSAKILQPAAMARAAAVAQAEAAGRLPDLNLELADVPMPIAEEYFKKIVSELVQNAFKFSQPGSPVRVGLKAVGEEVELSVQDLGCGFSLEHIQQIAAYVQFERKMQDIQGLGLGLAIAKKLVELHGGRLAVASCPDAGTTVTVKLPQPKKS